MNIKQAIEKISLKDLIESTGRVAVSGNAAKGEYLYSAPYREDNDPSLKINIHQKRFIDFGQDDAKGDVIQLARLIMGNGNASSITVSEALQWLKQFSGGVLTPATAKALQKQEKQAPVASFEGDRFRFVKSVPFSKKSHPNNQHYVTEVRKISLAVASHYLDVVTYRDMAPSENLDNGYRYGIGMKNDVGGYEVRASSVNSNFKTSLGQKGITTFNGKNGAIAGDIFEGQFDFLTNLEIRSLIVPENPTIILNTGRFASKAAEEIKKRSEWAEVKYWRIWQHNDDEGDRTTQVICTELGEDYSIGTLNHYWTGYNDLNEWWTTAPAQERDNLVKQFQGIAPSAKFYDTSASSEIRRFQDAKRGGYKPL
jgi:hypothetical protein